MKTKKITKTNVTLVRIEPGTSDSKSNTLLSELIRHIYWMSRLFYVHAPRISSAWLYKDLKVSVLQANAHLAQKGECWTWNQRFQIRDYILLLEYFISYSKASDTNIDNFVCL